MESNNKKKKEEEKTEQIAALKLNLDILKADSDRYNFSCLLPPSQSVKHRLVFNLLFDDIYI